MSAEHDETGGAGYETQFAAAISEAAEAYRIQPDGLVDTAWARGRRLRRRRRAGMLAGGAAALALIVTGGTLATGDRTADRSLTAAAQSARPVSGEEFLGMLTELLPAGRVEVGQAQGTEAFPPQLRLVLDDGGGAAQFLFWIMPNADITVPEPGRCGTSLPAGDTCTESTLANGDKAVVYQSGPRAGEPAGSKTWSASVYSPRGYHLMLEEWNRRPLENGTPVTRTDPPLSPERLLAVASDARWERVAGAIKKPQFGTGPKQAPDPAKPTGPAPLSIPPALPTSPVPGTPMSSATPPPGDPAAATAPATAR